MSHFTSTLIALMAVEKWTQERLAQVSGIERTAISRLTHSKRPSHKQLRCLVSVISPEPKLRLELLLAYLRDEASVGLAAGIDERHYVISPAEEIPQNHVAVPASLLESFKILIEECAQHEDIRSALDDLAHMIIRQRAEIADAKATVYPFPAENSTIIVASEVGPVGAAVQREDDRRKDSNRDRNST